VVVQSIVRRRFLLRARLLRFSNLALSIVIPIIAPTFLGNNLTLMFWKFSGGFGSCGLGRIVPTPKKPYTRAMSEFEKFATIEGNFSMIGARSCGKAAM
jgi:hypothetical protein